MKKILATIIIALCATSFAGTVGKPTEHLALPEVSGGHLVCIWDQTAGAWIGGFESYDHSGTYNFAVPEWGRWYWIGLWDEAKGEYVYSKWIGHFLTD
ncbi:hypothetical protein PDESU_03362 [Pontiella desulfatans]|uniref:Uncharacterized protein n=1 Tax=Pontiella desulfatans TaxID=2750659 RepID=A0A6C2U4I2_PONDE|nr:hypothetical protein [Pontiella desulfatans]VGO14793.1 hypothetical protein PDESU_03362 [Pontiella desulfatans]